MKNYRRITVKIGSNVLTRTDGTLDITRLSAIVDQVSQLRAQGIEVILISSGAVACGRSELRDAQLSQLDNVDARQLFSAVGQVKLINRYYDLFRDHGINVGQVLTMKESYSTRRHYLNQRNCMMVMLRNNIIPIVNENDTVSLTELMFTDNDELSGLIAAMLDCDALIILSNIDGIYNGDPRTPGAEVIRRVDPDVDLTGYIRTERSGFGRGGMVTKYRIARKVADEGIAVIIANGKRNNILTDIVLGDTDTVFTEFAAAQEPASSLKRWIAHSDGFVKGAIIINDRAVEAVNSEHATSILPIGVIGVTGDFDKDDLIKVLDSEGHVVAIGRSSYSVEEVREAAGRRRRRPVIHYDYLYVE